MSTDAGGYNKSLPFKTSRIGVIGSQLSHWSGQIIRVPDKDKGVPVQHQTTQGLDWLKSSTLPGWTLRKGSNACIWSTAPGLHVMRQF